jgi:hypothetical protein
MHGQLNPPHIGVRPTTGTNPAINWEAVPPAQALSQLAELFGRRVIYRATDNQVYVEIPGRGGNLPDGSIARESPSLDSPETPTGVRVLGAPTRYQCLLNFDEAVAEEWDGSFVPINDVSYAPAFDGAVQISAAQAACDGSSNTFQAFVAEDGVTDALTGAMFEKTTTSAITAAADIAAAINASAAGM